MKLDSNFDYTMTYFFGDLLMLEVIFKFIAFFSNVFFPLLSKYKLSYYLFSKMAFSYLKSSLLTPLAAARFTFAVSSDIFFYFIVVAPVVE